VAITVDRGVRVPGPPNVNPRHAEVKQHDKIRFQLNAVNDDDSLQIIFTDHEAFDHQQVSCKGKALSDEVEAIKKGTFDYMVIARIGGQEFEDLHCPSIHVS
jgi:hypothetical protein